MSNNTLLVRINTAIEHNNLEKLLPNGEFAWDNCRFEVNPTHSNPCDYWIVFATTQPSSTAICNPANTLFISGEPPSKKIYPKKFYAQFARVVSQSADDPHPKVTLHASCLNWHVGLDLVENRYVRSIDEFVTERWPEKTGLISAICSSAVHTEGQRLRLALLKTLKAHFGDQLTHFGKGFTPIKDKYDAIAPFQYHLVLENDRIAHYWTEKISDSYIGRAFPFYVGCTNLEDYFDADSFLRIDPTDPEGAISIIEQALAEDKARNSRDLIDQARHNVLFKYNPFAFFANCANRWHTEGPKQRLTILSRKSFRPFPLGLLYRLQNGQY